VYTYRSDPGRCEIDVLHRLERYSGCENGNRDDARGIAMRGIRRDKGRRDDMAV